VGRVHSGRSVRLSGSVLDVELELRFRIFVLSDGLNDVGRDIGRRHFTNRLMRSLIQSNVILTYSKKIKSIVCGDQWKERLQMKASPRNGNLVKRERETKILGTVGSDEHGETIPNILTPKSRTVKQLSGLAQYIVDVILTVILLPQLISYLLQKVLQARRVLGPVRLIPKRRHVEGNAELILRFGEPAEFRSIEKIHGGVNEVVGV
jgi:hypothetical protein